MTIATRAGLVHGIGEAKLTQLGRYGIPDGEPDPAAYAEGRIDYYIAVADSYVLSFFPVAFDAAGVPWLADAGNNYCLMKMQEPTDKGASVSILEAVERDNVKLWQASKRQTFVDGQTGGRRGPLQPTAVIARDKYGPSALGGL